MLGGLLTPDRGDVGWRAAFIGGLVAGGLALAVVYPAAFPAVIDASTGRLVAAGLIVGFGTRLGSGCTSGHGVCGIARLSPARWWPPARSSRPGAATVLVANTVLGG